MRLGCALLVTVLALACPTAAQFHPDVFLITIDTLRADHVRCYGDKDIQTPALDALAADGIRFAQAFTPSPITNSSHTTILTGLLPSSHGVTDFAVPLATSHPTWAELLKQHGYHTAAFIGAIILDSKSLAPGLNRGFEYYDNFPEHPKTTSRWGRVERRGMEVVERAEKWLAEHPADPHFVWVHLYDPHDPYEPPSPYAETYKGRPYDGEIAYADSALGDFLGYIKRRGWYENALVMVVGDHGEGLGEHGEDTHGIFLYDATTHVPLIIKLPGNAGRRRVVNAQVRTIDILPTVLDLLSFDSSAKLDGESLKPYFTDSEKTDRVVLGETDYPLRFGWAPLRSVRTPEFKFIEAPKPEFYDLRADPGETKNTYDDSNKTVRDARAMLTDLRPKPSAIDEDPALLPDPKDKIQEANLLHTAMMASEDERPADARSALEKVLQVDPKSPTALRQLGELELKAADYSKAAEHLKAAREVRPGDATAAFYEGQAREKLGDYAGARDALEASLKLAPGQLAARLLLGKVYLDLKDGTAAEDQFEAASLLDGSNAESQLGIVRANLLLGKPRPALDLLKKISAAQPKSPDVFDLLSEVYKALGKTREAADAEAHARLLRGKAK